MNHALRLYIRLTRTPNEPACLMGYVTVLKTSDPYVLLMKCFVQF